MLQNDGKTVSSFISMSTQATAIGLIALRDELREDALKAWHSSIKMGVHSVMLTGDNHPYSKSAC